MHLHRLSWPHPQFSWRDLQERWRTFGSDGRLINGPTGEFLRLLRAERIHTAGRREEYPAARDRGAGENRLRRTDRLAGVVILAPRHLDLAEDLDLVRLRTHDQEFAGFRTYVELAVGQHQWRFLHRANLLAPNFLTGCRIPGKQPRGVGNLVEPIRRSIDHW